MSYLYALLISLAVWLGYSTVMAEQVQKDILFSWDVAVCEGTCVGGVDGYRIYTEQGGLVADVQGTEHVVGSYSVTVGVASSFYVTAYNEDGESDPSALASVKVDGTAPSSTVLRAVFR